MLNIGRIGLQFWKTSEQLRRNFSANLRHDLVFRKYSMHDYHNIHDALVDLCRRCEDTNQILATNGLHRTSLVHFHCEFTDYFRCMEQYSESYCYTVIDSIDNRVIACSLVNLKQLHFGPYIMMGGFGRLVRVRPTRQRNTIGLCLLQNVIKEMKRQRIDYCLAYTMATNLGSLALQNKVSQSVRMEKYKLNIFVVPTDSNHTVTQLRKLTSKETEHLWMNGMNDWVNRPVLSDLQHIMQMNEYLGTFAVGDFPLGRYALASVWQPSNVILCDDRSNMRNPYRGPYRLVFNFFESPTATSCTNDEKRILLSTLSSAAAADGIPFILCHIDQSSSFNAFLQKHAVAVVTEIMSRKNLSSRITAVEDEFDKLTTWLDPRDFSGLLYFTPVSGKDSSNL